MGKSVADVEHMLKMWDKEKNTENPEDVSARCEDKKFWICPVCQYEWSAMPISRYQSSGKCPCHESNKAIKKGVNDILTKVSGLKDLLDDDNDFDRIYTEGVNSSFMVNYKCKECGRTWSATLLSQVVKDGNTYKAKGCPHYNTVKRKPEDIPFCSEVEKISKFWDFEKNSLDINKTKSNDPSTAYFKCKNCGQAWEKSIREQEHG
ncbi:MAG: zinc-ribbon domain-containing protein, partial [Lachnospiraceae bacterium]|nr:zinc-ribbon domain-containing protein [Lachnospiraceae bacterium]